MKTITVRGIDPDLAAKLKQVASEQSKSINQIALETLKKGLGLEPQEKLAKIYHDLDHLFGSWTEEEFTTIEDKINRERKIDEELW
ncbi:MAG: antitoxin [bacterium]